MHMQHIIWTRAKLIFVTFVRCFAVNPATDGLTQSRGAAEKSPRLLCGSASLREMRLADYASQGSSGFPKCP